MGDISYLHLVWATISFIFVLVGFLVSVVLMYLGNNYTGVGL